ncbi:Beta-barrel assembly-enhancing protease [bacterium HR40]|nr:Beta-barrel assembly-enhancing protease [bacterium HR40]
MGQARRSVKGEPFPQPLSGQPRGRGPRPFWSFLASLALLVGCAAGGTPSLPTAGQEAGPAGNYLAGMHALRAGDLRAARDLLERAVAADPGDLELRRQLFRLQLATGERQKAVASARELFDLGVDLAEAHLLLAVDAAAREDWSGARSELERVAGRGAIDLAVPLLDAWALFGLEGAEAGVRRLADADASEGVSRLHDYHAAMMRALAGDIEGARRIVVRLVRQSEAAPTRLVFATAHILDRAGERERALGIVRAQLGFVPENAVLRWLEQQLLAETAIPPPFQDATGGMADALTGLAQALAEEEARDQALLFARLATFLDPKQADAWLVVARLALERKDLSEAVEALAQVPMDSPAAWEARLLQADALVEAGKREEAVALLERMAAERPARIDALLALGDLYRREERFAEAEKAYAAALARVPQPTRAHWRLFYVHGISLERTGRWPEAERQFLKALELEPEQPFVLNYLGYSWVEKGMHLDRAKEMLHRAVELRPRDGFIVDSLGWAYYQLGEYERAVEYLERAVELEPGDPVINDHLGDAYWRVGRRREARFQWERALSLKPDSELAAKIEGKLRAGLGDGPSSVDRG